MTVSAIAAELEVSDRTVYRDLAALSAGGVPVITQSGPGGGCQLLDGYRFPLRGLRPEEAEALLILGVPGALRDLGLDQAASAAHRQIRVTAGLAQDAAAGTALVHLDMPRWFRGGEQVPQLRVLAEALRRGRNLEIEYLRGDRDPEAARPRVVGPLGLVNKAGRWYLVAVAGGAVACGAVAGGTGGGRVVVFRAGRVSAARVLAEPVERPADFQLGAFWERWSADFAASRSRLPVRLRASPLALQIMPEVFGEEVQPALDAALPPDEHGWQVVTLSFEHALAAAHRLAGFGGEVEVLSPPSVRQRLLETAREILDRYQAPDHDAQ
jgi:predicted DNA-binding transcriptional regulator YafY